MKERGVKGRRIRRGRNDGGGEGGIMREREKKVKLNGFQCLVCQAKEPDKNKEIMMVEETSMMEMSHSAMGQWEWSLKRIAPHHLSN